jgi:CDP-glucose 4,6-dehydratase
MHYLITGHTGFKGTWLIHFLHSLGHQISGIALPPETHSMFVETRAHELLVFNIYCDIRDRQVFTENVKKINPDVIIHFAAQAFVRESYAEPRSTYETNVNGTLNLLEVASGLISLRALLIVTTDKVYENLGQTKAFVETDKLGGIDPYSSSKAMADILSQSWMSINLGLPMAIARAGNVIGGGDFAEDRLIPNVIDSYKKSIIPVLRYPSSTRPWQHVLDCLNGYLTLIDAMIQRNLRGVWNFGPSTDSVLSVSEVCENIAREMKCEPVWHHSEAIELYEANYLMLDSKKANENLDWNPKYTSNEAIKETASWYIALHGGINPRDFTNLQINSFLEKKYSI